ncbi:hypothetical protein [Microcella sp.]|uniref:hypothetical protein n=1 Tax=Microcella sp. TaxID=1913979 RepID=UPI00299F7433|nr:hypothetical protein [Microcella sp.]MDX2026525.1 hypothetical protein [Microcella sp.]
MNNRTRAVIALGLGATLAVGPSLAAFGAGGTLTNGSFEADAVGSSSITGWTSMNQLIDLGTTSIAGCTTSDTSNYANLRDYASEAEGTWNNTYASVPGLSDIYYVHDLNGDPVTILGNRLVWDDWDGYYYIEIEDLIITSADAALSSVVEQPVTEPAPTEPAPTEPAPSEPAPESTTPAEPAPDEPAPTEPAPSEPAPVEPAPVEPPTPTFEPAEATYSYLIEWDWSSEQWDAFYAASAAAAPDPSVRADDPANARLNSEEYTVTVIDGVDVDREGNVLELYSDLDGDIDGYVAHGPAVYSDPFTVDAGRQISLDWKAVDESDDFHVFGYLLNTATCAQTEVIDATGESQDWTTIQVEIPAAGTYRFVFVSGSYDYSWGGAAGAYMYIDNIVQTPVFGAPGVDVALAAGVGDYLPGSDVQVSGGGLVPETEYDLVLRSTPVTVVQGVTDADGNFVNVVALPTDIEPGAHTITLTAQGPSGPVSVVAYITVGTDGTLQYFSLSGPQALLAFTGPAENAGIIALALLLTITGAAAIEFERRRRSPFNAVYVR